LTKTCTPDYMKTPSYWKNKCILLFSKFKKWAIIIPI